MKKILLVAFVLITSTNLFSQNFTYGVVLGASYIDGTVQKSSNSITESPPEKLDTHFGVFVDYQFSERFGVKLNTQYNRSYERYRFYYIPNSFSDEFSINSIQLIPHLKFDVASESGYYKGGYLLVGPRMSFVLSAKDQSGNDVTNFYKSTNFGAQFGFGVTIAKMFALEILGDYGFSDISESEPMEIRTAGAYLNLNFNLESIINK
ncbi:outer membrane beta-barrel protein [Xanthomarina spongicola]|uniref:Outer membrane protein with beta-barrel domain n=1 Tax=Xanthomarina spongicola TaxID=570520 RepID=A0A316DQU7_9FLAO|nr:outer membrane beta-barrel protein [Xanthomarina spongicola]PWK20345.1 outer membrane protein with beta-barrel domain [Xanthomarina spongicola]